MSDVLRFPDAKAKSVGRRRVRPIPDAPLADVREIAVRQSRAAPVNDADSLRDLSYHLMMAARAVKALINSQKEDRARTDTDRYEGAREHLKRQYGVDIGPDLTKR